MIMFIGGRCSGKTRRCIEFSVRTRIPILCQRPGTIKAYAKEYGLDIPEPISYSEYLSGKGIDLGSDRKVIIDELGLFLKFLGLCPEYVTLDETGNYITRDEENGGERMKDSMRDELIFCVGRLKGILSLVEFDSDEDGLVVNDRLNEVASDMELILKNVDEPPYLDRCDRVERR